MIEEEIKKLERRIEELEEENKDFKQKGQCHGCLHKKNVWRCQGCGYWFCADCLKEVYDGAICGACWNSKKSILRKMLMEFLES